MDNDRLMNVLTMKEAAQRLGVAEAAVARRLLKAAGLVQRIGDRLLIVSESDLETFAAERGGKIGPGRPRKKNEEE